MTGQGDQPDRRKVWGVRATFEALKHTALQKYMTGAVFSNDLCGALSLRDIRRMGVDNLHSRRGRASRYPALHRASEHSWLHDPVSGLRRVRGRSLEAPSDQFQKCCNAYAAVEELNHFLEGESGAFSRGGQLPNCPYQCGCRHNLAACGFLRYFRAWRQGGP